MDRPLEVSRARLPEEAGAAGPARSLGQALWKTVVPAVAYTVPPALALFLLGLGWELYTWIDGTPEYILPAPTVVLERLFSDLGFFASEGLTTTWRALAGFAAGAAVAVVLAALMAHSLYLERTIYPLAVLAKVTPLVAVAPLLVIWFGFGAAPKVVIAALLAFFPILVNGVIGFRSVNPGALDFLRSLRASRWEVFWRLRAPSSLPYLFAAIRITIPFAIIGAMLAEWFSGDSGLGNVINVSQNNLDMPTLFGAVITLMVIGLLFTAAAALVERRALHWHESTMEGDS